MAGRLISTLCLLSLVGQLLAAPQGYSYPTPSGPQLTGHGSGSVSSHSAGSSSSHSSSSSSSSSSHSSSTSSSSDASKPAIVVAILKSERQDPDETGAYSFTFETEDGVSRTETGESAGPEGGIVQTGEYSYTLPDGEVFTLTYVADENGFQPDSAFLPVAPPAPAYVAELILKAESERAEAAASGGSSSHGGSAGGSSSHGGSAGGSSSHGGSAAGSHASAGSSHKQATSPSQSYLQPQK